MLELFLQVVEFFHFVNSIFDRHEVHLFRQNVDDLRSYLVGRLGVVLVAQKV